MWSWHWSPLTQTSLLLCPSDGLASFLETTLANGVKVVEKVITSQFRFHLIAIYTLGVFSQFQLHTCTKITLKSWFLKIFSSETAWINEPTLDRNHSWKVLYKDCSFSSEALTYMAATGNSCFWLDNLKKSSPLKPLGQMNRNLIGSTMEGSVSSFLKAEWKVSDTSLSLKIVRLRGTFLINIIWVSWVYSK
jgi:hypothetical protein